MKCKFCGSEIAFGAKFCEECGTSLENVVDDTANAMMDIPSVSSQPQTNDYGMMDISSPNAAYSNNISLEKSDATKFVVDKENNALYPPFITLKGLGEAAAQSVIDARNEKPFISINDLTNRTKLTSTNIKELQDLGVLNGLDESDQLTFKFDI